MRSRLIGLGLLVLVMAGQLTAGLVAWYPMDDAPGSVNVADASGNNFHCGIWGTGDFTGTSFYFNRTADEQNYVFTPGNIPALTNQSFSWAMWVRADSTDPDGNGTLMHRGADVGWADGYKALSARPAELALSEYGQADTLGSIAIFDDQWHHVAVTYNDTGTGLVNIYVDGQVVGTKGMDLDIEPENTSWSFFMGLGAGGWFRGEMRDVRIYDEVLDAAAVAELAGVELGAGLVAWYPLNDAPGSAGFLDASGNGYHGGVWGAPNFTGSSFYFNQTGDAQNFLFTPTNMPALTNESFSWAVWVRCDTSDPDDNGTIIQRGFDSGWADGYKLLSVRPTYTAVQEYGQADTVVLQSLYDNEWHHLAATYDDTGLGLVTIYIDGEVAGFKGMNLAIEPEDSSWSFFMGLGAGGWFTGEMKQVRIYRGVLTDDEVGELAGFFAGDLDGDSDVDYDDLTVLTGAWLDDLLVSGEVVTPVLYGDFEAYTPTGDPNIADDWSEYYYAPSQGSTSSSAVALLTNPADAYEGNQALRWTYDSADTSGNGFSWTEILFDFSSAIDMTQYDEMRIRIKRHAGNSQEDILYIKYFVGGTLVTDLVADSYLEEAEGSTFADPDQWSLWTIDLNNLDLFHMENGYTDKSDLDAVVGFQLGVFDAVGGQGVIDIDAIELVQNAVCSESVADINDDCKVDGYDFRDLAADWMKDPNNPGL